MPFLKTIGPFVVLIQQNIYISKVDFHFLVNRFTIFQSAIHSLFFGINNHDETPPFVNYGSDGIPQGLVYAGCGDACQKMIREN